MGAEPFRLLVFADGGILVSSVCMGPFDGQDLSRQGRVGVSRLVVFPFVEDFIEGMHGGHNGYTTGITGGVTNVVPKRKGIRVYVDWRVNAGVYDTKGKQKTYHEVVIREIGGIIANGNSPLI